VLPREIEDILGIKASERHRWLKDGRLPTAGSKTVKLKGRASKITFFVFDPRVVEDLLDREVVFEWREQDAIAAAENRRRAGWNRRIARSPSRDGTEGTAADPLELTGWEEFEREGPWRR